MPADDVDTTDRVWLQRAWDAWSSRIHSILIGVLSLLLAALFMEKLTSDWYVNRYPAVPTYPDDAVMLGLLFVAYMAFFVMFFIRPDLPLLIADKFRKRFFGKEGAKQLLENAAWLVAGLFLAWLLGKPLLSEISSAIREFANYALIVLGAGIVAGIVYVLFCRHPKAEMGVRAWINRAGLAVIAAVSVWLVDWATVAPYVPAEVKGKYVYDLTKDLLAVAIAVVFIVAASYELSRHVERLRVQTTDQSGVHSLVIPFSILVGILVPTIVVYAVILFFDFQWVNAIELRPGEIASLMGWTRAQMDSVRQHIIVRDVYVVIPLLALSLGWAGVRLYYAWSRTFRQSMIDDDAGTTALVEDE